jgi:predicted ATPase
MAALAEPLAQDLPTPTIQSDKADYAAAELVTLTGTGWTGDTTVTIVVTDAAPTVYHDTDQVQVQPMAQSAIVSICQPPLSINTL